MSIEINEIRPGDHQAVAALLGDDQETIDNTTAYGGDGQTPCETVLSLVARDQDDIVGAILCYHDHIQGHCFQLTIADSGRYPDLAKDLVDKALRKLNAHGTHRCRIQLWDDTQLRPFWEAAKWTGRPDLTQHPVRSSAMVDRLVNHEEPSVSPTDDGSEAEIQTDPSDTHASGDD